MPTIQIIKESIIRYGSNYPNQKAVHRILEKLGFTVFGCVDSYTAADAVARTCEKIARKGEGDRR